MNNADQMELELSIPDWATLKTIGGHAKAVPVSLRKMLQTQVAEEARSAYWELEGTVVVSGGLYTASEYVIPVLVAALVDLDRPAFARNNAYELLFQIVNGYSAPSVLFLI